MKPEVSVVVTTYNRPESLKRAVASVLVQNFENLELLIVDDGSEEKPELPKDSRVRYFRNEKNMGGTYSLNRGLKEAKGEFICPLDDDDEWIDNQKLSKQSKFLESHPDYVAVGTNAEVRLLGQAGELIKIVKTNAPLSNEEIHKRLIFTNQVAHVSSMYRKEAATKIGGYDENLERGKDWDLFLKLGRVGKLANIADICVRFDEKRKVSLKYNDSKDKLRIMWRHRDYPNFWQSFLIEAVRICVFRALTLI